MAKTGRPSMLTAEITEKICELLRTGAPLETCADAVGVWPTTLERWQHRARECIERHGGDADAAMKDENDGACVEFCGAVARARADAELMLLAKVSAAGKGGWAAGWILERVMRRRYHTRSESKIDAKISESGDGGDDADEAARRRADEFLKAGGEGDQGEDKAEG